MISTESTSCVVFESTKLNRACDASLSSNRGYPKPVKIFAEVLIADLTRALPSGAHLLHLLYELDLADCCNHSPKDFHQHRSDTIARTRVGGCGCLGVVGWVGVGVWVSLGGWVWVRIGSDRYTIPIIASTHTHTHIRTLFQQQFSFELSLIESMWSLSRKCIASEYIFKPLVFTAFTNKMLT